MALRKVTFVVNASTLMVVVGPNGAGKSPMFNMIARPLPVHQGVTLRKVDRRIRAQGLRPPAQQTPLRVQLG